MAEGAGVRQKKEVTRFIEEEGPAKDSGKDEKIGGQGEGTVSLHLPRGGAEVWRRRGGEGSERGCVSVERQGSWVLLFALAASD